MKRRFSLEYHEEATLRDGSSVHFRLLRPDDKALLVDGLARMSPESRFRRFFAHRDRLSQAELAYLTEIDQETHFALGAARRGPDGTEQGLGVARFVVIHPSEGETTPAGPNDPRGSPSATSRAAKDGGDGAGGPIAEAAVAVVDEAQGKGLGRMLFERLVDAAAERGIAMFRFDVLAENDTMLGLVKSLFPNAAGHVEHGIMTIDCPIPPPPAQDERPAFRESAMYRILKLAAEGAIRVLRRTHASEMTPVLKGGAADHKEDHDLAELIGLTDEDGPAP